MFSENNITKYSIAVTAQLQFYEHIITALLGCAQLLATRKV
jgi:hypothetical protein